MSGRFVGRGAVITGGGSGIGLATARRLGAEGAEVVLLDPDDDALAMARDGLARDGIDVTTVTGTSVDPDARREAVAAASAGAGRDRERGQGGIVVNAGASFLAKGVDATADDWHEILDHNVAGYALMVADAVELLADGGAVVNVASVSGHIAQPSRWTYNAAKGAVLSLTRCQALDLAPRGIRVNSVSPAWIWTGVVERLAGDDADRKRPEWGAYHLLGRIGEADEVAAAIAFLASDDASFVTASDLPVDGGYLAVGGEGTGTDGIYGQLRDG